MTASWCLRPMCWWGILRTCHWLSQLFRSWPTLLHCFQIYHWSHSWAKLLMLHKRCVCFWFECHVWVFKIFVVFSFICCIGNHWLTYLLFVSRSAFYTCVFSKKPQVFMSFIIFIQWFFLFCDEGISNGPNTGSPLPGGWGWIIGVGLDKLGNSSIALGFTILGGR